MIIKEKSLAQVEKDEHQRYEIQLLYFMKLIKRDEALARFRKIGHSEWGARHALVYLDTLAPKYRKRWMEKDIGTDFKERVIKRFYKQSGKKKGAKA